MKAATILDAIIAMKAMDAIDYTTRPAVWATALTNLANARFELQYELGAVDVAIEPQTDVQAASGGLTQVALEG